MSCMYKGINIKIIHIVQSIRDSVCTSQEKIVIRSVDWYLDRFK